MPAPFSIPGAEDLDVARLVAATAEETSHLLAAMGPDEADAVLRELPRAAQVVFLTSELEAEVMIGSFVAYFENRSGRHASMAAQAFREIGAGAIADVVEEAARVHAPHAAEWERRALEQQQSAQEEDVVQLGVPLPGSDALEALTDRFHAATEAIPDGWGALLETYVDARREELAGSGG